MIMQVRLRGSEHLGSFSNLVMGKTLALHKIPPN